MLRINFFNHEMLLHLSRRTTETELTKNYLEHFTVIKFLLVKKKKMVVKALSHFE